MIEAEGVRVNSSSVTCDYLVIGGGSSGAVLARRLAEWTQAHVILLEAGKADEGDPAALFMSKLEQQDECYDWGYAAQPVRGGTSMISYARARMLGGCANHNDCAFIAPPPSDLDHWNALGAKGWDVASLRSALQRVAVQTNIEQSPQGNLLSRAVIDAAIELGLPERNFRDSVAAGTGWFPLNAKGDLRQSSSITYLHPLKRCPKNLDVMTETLVHRIVFDGKRAVAVETNRGRISANIEIILCAGSINTPHLLMLSGVGPVEQLKTHGIPVVLDAQGVGQNLIDHVAANIAYELKAPAPAWERTPCESTVLLQVDADAPAPDVLFHFIMRLREKYVGLEQFKGVLHGVKFSPNVARPKSRGSVTLQSHDHLIQPIIDLNYLSDAEGYDKRILLAGLRFARKLAGTQAMAPWLSRELVPGINIESDDELFAYVRETCETVYHPCGTCRMGAAQDHTAVVTPDLKVKGIENLRIADASVFPDMVTVNINNTVMMVAEQAAAIITETVAAEY
jgi:choline oxidase